MSYDLTEGLSFCLIDGNPIFLNVRDNRYFTLNARQGAVFLKTSRGDALESVEAETAKTLCDKGVLRPASGGHKPFACPTVLPTTDQTYRQAGERSSLHAKLSIFWHLISAILSLKVLGLNSQLARLRRCKSRLSSSPSGPRFAARTPDYLAAYRWSGLITGSHDQCLWRSLALARLLLSNNIDCSIILGVSIRPFSAHCWVQHDQEVFNDTCENVCNFKPIFSL